MEYFWVSRGDEGFQLVEKLTVAQVRGWKCLGLHGSSGPHLLLKSGSLIILNMYSLQEVGPRPYQRAVKLGISLGIKTVT